MPHLGQSNPWRNSGCTSENLFETRKNWPIPSNPATTHVPTMKTEEAPQGVAIPHAMVMPKQVAEKCLRGTVFPYL